MVVDGDYHVHEDVELSMTFLQFCPTCEKQIPLSNISILYCSESCRRRDSLQNPCFVPSPTSDVTHHPALPTSCNLLPGPLPSNFNLIASKPPVIHHTRPDLDPTEWKPDLENDSVPSVAAQFLAQFHQTPCALLSKRRTKLSTHFVSQCRLIGLLGSHAYSIHARSITSYSEESILGTPSSHQLGSSPLIHFSSINRANSNYNGSVIEEESASLLLSRDDESGKESKCQRRLGAAGESLKKLLTSQPL